MGLIEKSQCFCRVSAVTSVSATVAVWLPVEAGPRRDERGTSSFDCHVATIAQGEQEGTRHPEFPMPKILLVLKSKNMFYSTSGVYNKSSPSTYEREITLGAKTDRLRKTMFSVRPTLVARSAIL